MAPCRNHTNIAINFVWGGGGQVHIFVKDPPVFEIFSQEVRDQGRVWYSAENFDNDLLVLGRESLSISCK